MRLMKLREFKRIVYSPESAPSDSTLRRRIEQGKLPGGLKDGSIFYVDMDKFDQATNLRAELAAQQQQLATNPLLAALI